MLWCCCSFSSWCLFFLLIYVFVTLICVVLGVDIILLRLWLPTGSRVLARARIGELTIAKPHVKQVFG